MASIRIIAISFEIGRQTIEVLVRYRFRRGYPASFDDPGAGPEFTVCDCRVRHSDDLEQPRWLIDAIEADFHDRGPIYDQVIEQQNDERDRAAEMRAEARRERV